MSPPPSALSRAHDVLYDTRTVLEQKVTSDPVGALDTTTNSLKAVEAVLLAAIVTLGFSAGWELKLAADGQSLLVIAVVIQTLVVGAAGAASVLTQAARGRLDGERRLHEEALDGYQPVGARGGCQNACPSAVKMRRLTKASCIEVRGPLSDELFAAVQATRNVPRHKRWAEHYVFGELTSEQADRIAELLADAGVAFTLEVNWESTAH
jgi:hypothetical protein